MTRPAAAANNNNTSTFSNPIELPSMQIADASDRQKDQAFDALEFSSDGQYQYVKCQCCYNSIRIVGKLERLKSERIEILKKRRRYAEAYNLKSNNKSSAQEVKKLKDELDDLLKQEEKRDRLRHLPLYNSKCTGYRFFCSPCWDKVYALDQKQRKNKI